MPRNLTGGSGHKARSNIEHPKTVSNRRLIDDYLEDCTKDDVADGLYVGRVIAKFGCGRMDVFYMKEKNGYLEEVTERMPLDVSLKRSTYAVPIGVDTLVLLTETGLGRREREIMGAFNTEQIKRYRTLYPDADSRLFVKTGEDEDDEDAPFIFDRSGEGEGEGEQEEPEPEKKYVKPTKRMEPPKPKAVLNKADKEISDIRDIDIDAI
jgi:hypothetical protein